MKIIIRSAEASDAESIADAHVTSWRVAYRGVVADAYLDSPEFARARREGWRRRLEGPDSRRPNLLDEILVPVVDGRVVGFGHVGPQYEAKNGVPMSETGELHGFYIHPDAWGTGAADVLLGACHTALASRAAAASLWVLRDNPRARRFYERHGWSCGTGDEFIEDVWNGPQMLGMPPFEPVAELQYRRTFASQAIGSVT